MLAKWAWDILVQYGNPLFVYCESLQPALSSFSLFKRKRELWTALSAFTIAFTIMWAIQYTAPEEVVLWSCAFSIGRVSVFIRDPFLDTHTPHGYRKLQIPKSAVSGPFNASRAHWIWGLVTSGGLSEACRGQRSLPMASTSFRTPCKEA